MKKRDIVRKKELFNNIIANGKRISNKYFVISQMPKEEIFPSFGIAVGKKVGNAVTRNKIKRKIRHIIDDNRFLFSNYFNYIIICKRDILSLTYQEMEQSLKELLNNKGD